MPWMKKGGAGSGANIPTDTGEINCTLAESIGDWVYLDAPNEVRQARADNIATSRVFGRIISKPTTVTCVVRRYGETNIDAGLTGAEKYYLSDTVLGGMTLTQPSIGNQVELGWAINSTRFYIDVYNKVIIKT